MVKNLSANAGDARDVGSIPESGRSPGVGNDKPPQYSCPENSMDSGAWRVTVHGAAESDTTEATQHARIAILTDWDPKHFVSFL